MLFEAAEMSDKEALKFWLTPLKAKNYFMWTHEMKILLCGCKLREFVERKFRSENSEGVCLCGSKYSVE